jgi:hypothetical protein
MVKCTYSYFVDFVDPITDDRDGRPQFYHLNKMAKKYSMWQSMRMSASIRG